MASTSRSAGFSNRPFTLIMEVSSRDDAANNRSFVNYKIKVRSDSGMETFSFVSSNRVYATVDGQSPGSPQFTTLDFRGRPAGTTFTIMERDITVNHNSDGGKTISFSGGASLSTFGTANVSGSLGLTTYARAPNPPATVTASTPVARTIAVSFDAASGGAGVSNYDVERRENSASWQRILSSITYRNFTDTNLNPRSTYRYRVRANGPGGSSGYRESGSQTIAPAASPPVTTAERTLRTVEVTMTEPSVIDNTTNIISYTTQRRQNNGTWGDTKTTTDLNNRSITYTNLPSETNQQFRGRADTDRGSSDFSESSTIFIPGIPDPPSQVLALRFGTSILVAISAPVSDNGAPVLTYTLQQRESSDGGETFTDWGQTQTLSPSSASFLDEDVELQKTYQYRALATNEEGDSEQFTESDQVYIPRIFQVYDFSTRSFRNPLDYKRYDATIGGWIGLSIAKRYSGGEWVEID